MKHKIQIIKTNELGDPAQTLYSGDYEERALPPSGCLSVKLTRDDWDDDDEPLRLAGGSRREITDEEEEFLAEHAAVTQLVLRYPSASRYGSPLAACSIASEEFGKATVGSLGYCPAEELEVIPEDTGDDSGESYVLEFSYPIMAGWERLFRDTP